MHKWVAWWLGLLILTSRLRDKVLPCCRLQALWWMLLTGCRVPTRVCVCAHTDLFAQANTEYHARAVNEGRLDMPVLFLTAAYDYVCECVDSDLPNPMRELCSDLTEFTINSGHWMAQEKPVDVSNALVQWLLGRVSGVWPSPPL